MLLYSFHSSCNDIDPLGFDFVCLIYYLFLCLVCFLSLYFLDFSSLRAKAQAIILAFCALPMVLEPMAYFCSTRKGSHFFRLKQTARWKEKKVFFKCHKGLQNFDMCSQLFWLRPALLGGWSGFLFHCSYPDPLAISCTQYCCLQTCLLLAALITLLAK